MVIAAEATAKLASIIASIISNALFAHRSAVFADITSANVVGYKAEALKEGFVMVAPTFVDVADSSKGQDLTSLVAGGDYGSGDISVQTLTELGETDVMFEFVKDRKGRWFWRNADTGDEISEGDVNFAYGTGLWVSGVENAQLTVAGQVSTADVVINLREGFVAAGNMTPVAVDLTALVPGGDYGSGDISVQTLTELGETDVMFEFVKDRKGRWFWRNADTGDEISEGDVVFAAGVGLWISGVDGAALTVPGVAL